MLAAIIPGSVKRESTVELHEVGQLAHRRRAPRDRERCAVAGRVLGRRDDCPQAAHVDEREFVEVDQNGLATLAQCSQVTAHRRCAGQVELAEQEHADSPVVLYLNDLQQGSFVAQRACSFR